MKELSIEEKAKCYDEALERAKDMLSYKEVRMEDMEYLFPELAESDDEKIRKELIHYFSDGVEFLSLCSFSREDILAWLEKQDPKKLEEQFDKMIEADLSWLEKSTADKVEPKFNIGDTIINKTTKEQFTINGKSLALQYYHDEDHLHEVRFTEQDDWEIYEPIKQNSTKWGEEDKEIFGYLEDIVNFCYCNQYVVNVQTCEKVRQLVFRLKSSCFQSGWSKDDITRINEIIETLNIVQANRVRTQRMHYNKATIDKNIDWLKSLKGRVQPQLKQEWSEKDTEILNGIANYLFTSTDVSNVEGSDEWYDWLKSLKSRVQLKQEWKEWSEEDEDVFDYLKGLTYSRKDTKLAQRAIDWLKSIRHQKQWKPSKEQMKALHDLNLTGNLSYAGQGQALIDLYNSLKELC